MLSSIDGGQATVAGICVFIVVAFIRGWIVTRAQHAEVVADRDFWREQATEKDATIAAYVETARTATHALQSLPAAADILATSGGGSNAAQTS